MSDRNTKHIFYIHSQTCYVISLKIVQYENLDINNVLFLLARNTPIVEPKFKHYHIYPIIDNWGFYKLRSLLDMRWLNNRRVVNLIDNFIENVVPVNFIFYSQNGRHYKYNIFISSKKCIGNNYIEDGLDMYSSNSEFNIKYPNPLKIRHLVINKTLSLFQGLYKRIFQLNNPFWAYNYNTKFYLLHEYSMKYIECNLKKINLEKIRLNFICDELEDLPILLPSALEEQNICNNKHVLKSYLIFCSNRNISKAYIKWHPAHTNQSKNYFLNIFKANNIGIIELPNNLSMELYFSATNKLHKVISNGSSVLIYAALFGKNCSAHIIYPILHNVLGKKTPRSDYWINTYSQYKIKNLHLETNIK
jgi:hypothetical protein